MQLRSCVAVAVFKPIAIAPILPLARELPYAVVAALKREKKKKRKSSITNFQITCLDSMYSLRTTDMGEKKRNQIN